MIISKNGTIISTFRNLIAFCDDQVAGFCVITLNSAAAEENAFVYDAELGITFDLAYNEATRLLSLAFVTCDVSGNCETGAPKNVTLEAIKLDLTGTQACITSIVSASGTISCTIPNSIGNETISVSITVDGFQKYSEFVRTGQEINLGFGGYFVCFS